MVTVRAPARRSGVNAPAANVPNVNVSEPLPTTSLTLAKPAEASFWLCASGVTSSR